MKAGKKIPRCRLCSAPAADRMRMLDFETEEQPLCLACIRPYDQGAKAVAAILTRDLERLQDEYRRLSEQACDRLTVLLQARHETRALKVALGLLLVENERLRAAQARAASPGKPAARKAVLAGEQARRKE